MSCLWGLVFTRNPFPGLSGGYKIPVPAGGRCPHLLQDLILSCVVLQRPLGRLFHWETKTLATWPHGSLSKDELRTGRCPGMHLTLAPPPPSLAVLPAAPVFPKKVHLLFQFLDIKVGNFRVEEFSTRLGLGTFVTLLPPLPWKRRGYLRTEERRKRTPKMEVELEAASLIVVCCPVRCCPATASAPSQGINSARRSGVLSGVLITNKLNLLQVIFLRTPLTCACPCNSL